MPQNNRSSNTLHLRRTFLLNATDNIHFREMRSTEGPGITVSEVSEKSIPSPSSGSSSPSIGSKNVFPNLKRDGAAVPMGGDVDEIISNTTSLRQVEPISNKDQEETKGPIIKTQSKPHAQVEPPDEQLTKRASNRDDAP